MLDKFSSMRDIRFMKPVVLISFAVATCYIAGFIGSLFVSTDTLAWYGHLVKPSLTPDSWYFFPAWMILYGLMGFALGHTWSKTDMWNSWTGLFYVSLVFNIAWLMFFFAFHTIFIALVIIICLALLLVILTLSAWEIDRTGAYLLTPYLLWVLFATYLNTQFWLLN